MDFKKKDNKSEEVKPEEVVEEKPKKSTLKSQKKVVVGMKRTKRNSRGQWEWEEVYE